MLIVGSIEVRARSVGKEMELPLNTRDDIYRGVLIVAHPLYRFQDRGSGVAEDFGPECKVDG